MSNSNMINCSKQQSSICPTNGRQTVGDGAFSTDMIPSVLAVCQMQGTDQMYYYSTTFSGGPGVGGFDTPNAKCPPDRGSSDWVTDSPAPLYHSSSPTASTLSASSLGSDSPYTSIEYPPTPPPDYAFPSGGSAPRAIAQKHQPLPDVATPPLTPDDGEGIATIGGCAALDFLSALFPRNALGALPFAKSVSISAPNLGGVFEGVVLELPGTSKTLYVDGKSAAHVNLRESIVALLDLADERLNCTALVITLERSSPVLGDLLHSLMYVGGTVVTKPPFPVDSGLVLVGMEI